MENIGLNYDYNLSQDYILTHSKAIDRNKNFKILCGIDKDQNQLFKSIKNIKNQFSSLYLVLINYIKILKLIL